MSRLSYEYRKTSLIPAVEIAAQFAKLKPEIERLQRAIDAGYQTPYASINLPTDESMHQTIVRMVEKKRLLKPTLLIVIGIGGSNLGTIALHHALNGILYNEVNPALKVYFADTVDPDYIHTLTGLVETELSHGGEVLINVVTKSGTTTETIANYELFFSILERAKGQAFHQYIVVTTDEDSPLWRYAQKEGIDVLSIPKEVGGRYSVFSAVGQFPLALLGINVKELLLGAHSIIPQCVSSELETNYAALRATLLACWYADGKIIHDTFLFSTDLEGVGRWYRQLMGESIGKKYDAKGKEVFVGITPTVSIGTNDLHSVGQLYLGGPYDKATTFVSVQKYNSSVRLPTIPVFEPMVPHLQGKSMNELMDAVLRGVKKAYEQDKRSYDSIVLPEKSPRVLGQLMQMQMIEMIYLGFLLNIDPFNQPQVERYKSETRKILAHG